MTLDFEAWRCKHEKLGENLFCPDEGCSKADGCARERGWLPPLRHIHRWQYSGGWGVIIGVSRCADCGKLSSPSDFAPHPLPQETAT